jgi:hypothetical protein
VRSPLGDTLTCKNTILIELSFLRYLCNPPTTHEHPRGDLPRGCVLDYLPEGINHPRG